MKQNQDVDFQPEPHAWDQLTLIISDELQKSMDKKLISAADLKEAIWLAESSGDKFYDESDGMCMCQHDQARHHLLGAVSRNGSTTYEVLSAYYHRMRFDRGEQPA